MMRSTTQANLEIVQDGLQFYYDVANPSSYSRLSPTTNRLYNLASNDDIILPGSGSTATLINQEYFTNYNGYLKCDDNSYIQFPGFADLSAGVFTLEFIISPQVLDNVTPETKNYIIKSDDDDGFFIKYYHADPNQLQIGSVNGTQDEWTTEALESRTFQLTMTYDENNSQVLEIYVDGQLEFTRSKDTLWLYFQHPFKIGYNFNTMNFYQFKFYNRRLLENEILINKEQIKARFGGLIV